MLPCFLLGPGRGIASVTTGAVAGGHTVEKGSITTGKGSTGTTTTTTTKKGLGVGIRREITGGKRSTMKRREGTKSTSEDEEKRSEKENASENEWQESLAAGAAEERKIQDSQKERSQGIKRNKQEMKI